MPDRWEFIGHVKSESSKHRKYDLEVNQDGDLRCPCASYIHALAPKSCKHTSSTRAGALLRAHQAKKRVSVGGTLIPRYCPGRMYVDGVTVDTVRVLPRDLDLLEEVVRACFQRERDVWSVAYERRLRQALSDLGLSL